MKKSESWVGKILLLLFVAALLLLVIEKLPRFSFREIFRAKPVLIDNTPLVITQVKAIAELNTVLMYQELVIDSVASSPAPLPAIVNPFTFSVTPLTIKKELVLIVKGSVKAGIDLQYLSAKDVFVKDDSVSLSLPAAVITDVFLNPSAMETFYETGTWTNAEVIAVKQSARRKLIAEASRQKLLQKADEKAKAVFAQFLKTAGFKNITLIRRARV